MTFSLLAADPETGAIGGAAATGSLCVGGWVLRGAIDAGVSASQGAAPSTFWGEDVLVAMRAGEGAEGAVARITGADRGRAFRQLTALDLDGGTGAFTGASNDPVRGSLAFDGGIVAGNMLGNDGVLPAIAEAFAATRGGLESRLLAALGAGQAAGGDFRGLLSAALLVLRRDHAPLSLRIDHHPDDPLGALADLHARATSGDYAAWARQVPSAQDRERVLDG